MKHSAHRWFARLAAGAVCALAAGVLFAPAEARASCGDYVTMGHHGGHAESQSSARPDADQPAPAAPQKGRKPCSGPSCSRAPVSTPTPPAPPAPPRGTDWGTLTLAHLLDPSGSALCFQEDAAARPVWRGSDVYHPPR